MHHLVEAREVRTADYIPGCGIVHWVEVSADRVVIHTEYPDTLPVLGPTDDVWVWRK